MVKKVNWPRVQVPSNGNNGVSCYYGLLLFHKKERGGEREGGRRKKIKRKKGL
jgi:hypothetical protein